MDAVRYKLRGLRLCIGQQVLSSHKLRRDGFVLRKVQLYFCYMKIDHRLEACFENWPQPTNQ